MPQSNPFASLSSFNDVLRDCFEALNQEVTRTEMNALIAVVATKATIDELAELDAELRALNTATNDNVAALDTRVTAVEGSVSSLADQIAGLGQTDITQADLDAKEASADLASTAAGKGSARVGHSRQAVGAVPRTVFDRLNDGAVSPEEFGAAGDGVTNDQAAIQKAADTGRTVRFTGGKNYKITAGITAKANFQQFDLNGATITPVGNFDVFTINNSLHSVTVCNGLIEAAGMSGNEIFSITKADRTSLINLRIHNPYNLANIEEANVTHMDNVWVNNIRGSFGIRWYGTATKRSDILRLVGVNLSFALGTNSDGILWDGNCSTLQIQSVTIVTPGRGLRVLNSSGSTYPAFGFIDDLEIDYPKSGHGISLEAGEDFYLNNVYIHGSATGSGIYVGAAVPPDRVVITNGKITDHARYGIESSVRVRAINLSMFDNDLGDYSNIDKIYVRAPRLEVDGKAFLKFDGTNPLLNFDDNDSMIYDRAGNSLSVDIGATPQMRVSNNAGGSLEVRIAGVLARILAGDVDSGGVGYRMLRIAN